MSGELFGLRAKTIESLHQVFMSYPGVNHVIIYGSRAKGNFKSGSDIDLTILSPDLRLADLLKIMSQIDDLDLPYKIDLSLHHQIDNQSLIDHIARRGVDFWRR